MSDAYNKGRDGLMLPPGSSTLDHFDYEAGRRARGPGWDREKFREGVGGLVEVIAGNGIRGFLNSLVGTPIAVGFISGLVALGVGGDPVMAALIAAGATFAVVLVIGVLAVTVRYLIVLAPLLIPVAIVLYVLHRWLDVGPGLGWIRS